MLNKNKKITCLHTKNIIFTKKITLKFFKIMKTNKQNLLTFLFSIPFMFLMWGKECLAQPSISVRQAAISIVTGTGTHSFGNVNVGANSGMVNFTIDNQGTAPLNLS
ncbi:MAG: hypothetical protein EAZ97_15235, partial [Bacteroidetes bacterium]